MTDYAGWFSQVTGLSAGPYDWQQRLAQDPACRSRLIHIPTGLGKTEGVLGAWLWHAVEHQRPDWPRRLVWCLPMRVLVEQTAERARTMIDRWAGASGCDGASKPKVHILMGGEETEPWYLDPERPAVLVGTQDMLLSRALNRGYASAGPWNLAYSTRTVSGSWMKSSSWMSGWRRRPSSRRSATKTDPSNCVRASRGG